MILKISFMRKIIENALRSLNLERRVRESIWAWKKKEILYIFKKIFLYKWMHIVFQRV
jgi:hypothetical protein